MGKKQIIRIGLIVAALLWMAVIFRFSGQRAQVSGELSGSLSYRLARQAGEWFSLGWGEETLVRLGEVLEHPLRKAAHMAEYTLLAALFLGNFFQYRKTYGRKYFLAWICATLYAASDEFHQLFVEGRSGEIGDVCIDSTGAFVGLCFVYLVSGMIKKLSGKGQENKK